MARLNRFRRCKHCGKEFPVTGETEQALCDACRRFARQESVIRDRTCTVCGAVFPGGPSAKYCSRCRADRKRERDRERRRSGPARKLGSEQTCARCGEKYILTAGTQRYCPSCSKEAILENRRPKKREYQKNYDPDHEKRNALKDGVRLCVICGEPIWGDRQKLPVNTCSAECEKKRDSLKQASADLKRGKRKTLDTPRRAPDLPVSGVPGVTARRKGKPWQAQVNGHYIGVFDSIEEASEAIVQYKATKTGEA